MATSSTRAELPGFSHTADEAVFISRLDVPLVIQCDNQQNYSADRPGSGRPILTITGGVKNAALAGLG